MFKRIVAAAAALLFALALTPLSMAKTVPDTRYSAPEGYDAHDYAKLVAFLETEDQNGQTNGSKLSLKYKPEDPETWGWQIDWDDDGHVYSFYGSGMLLVGNADFSGCANLSVADLGYNQIDSALFTGCTSLKTLECGNNDLEELDLTGLSALLRIQCGSNSIPELDISECPGLTYLWCWDNCITGLEVSACPELSELLCYGNPLGELDLSNNPKLHWLMAGNTGLNSIDLSSCPLLDDVDVSKNSLRVLDLTENPLVNSLCCKDNLLTELDVSHLTSLQDLNCKGNAISSLKIPDELENVYNFDCSSNELTELTVGFTVAAVFDCTNNPLKSAELFTYYGTDGARSCRITAKGRGTIGFRSEINWDTYRKLNRFEAYPDEGETFLGWYDGEGNKISSDAVFETYEADYDRVSAKFTGSLGVPKMELSTVNSTGKAKVSWSEVEGAAKYEVWRSATKSGTYSKVFTTTKLEYTNTGAKAGDKWYYKVRAIAADGTKGEFCAPKYRTTKLPQPQVTGGHVASTGKNKLVWEAVDGAAGYEVWRSDSKTGTFKKMLTTENLTYTNTGAKAGEKWYYKVVAVHSNTAANSTSAVKGITCDLARPVITVKLSNNKPKVSWDAVDGAVGYEIWRRVGTSGDYTKIKTVTSTSFTNTGAAAGTKYYYKVVAVHSNTDANSAFSAAKSITSK